MLIHHDPDEYETVVTRTVCSFHQRNPSQTYAGCTCSMGIGGKKRPPEEVQRIKAQREREREDAVLAEADEIRARRGSKP